MLMLEDSIVIAFRKSNVWIAQLILVIFLLMPLAGCTNNDGAGGPIISNLSTPTEAATGLDSDQASNSELAHHSEDEEPVITMTPTPTGVTAHVTWEPPPHFNVAGYYIYYGKRSLVKPSLEEPSSESSSSEESSSEELNSCSYGESQAVEAPSATITGLEPNTSYFFAIRAFNSSESICSNEITRVTPSAKS